MEINNDTLLNSIYGITAAVVSLGLYLRKLKPTFAKDDLITRQAEADMGVISRLEHECQRLHDQNTLLAETLSNFQLELIKFKTENQILSYENSSLREENRLLREEIVQLRRDSLSLREDVSTLTGMVTTLQSHIKKD